MTKYNKTIYFMMLLLIYLCLTPFITAFIINYLRLNFNVSVNAALILFITPFICSFLPGMVYFLVSKDNIKETLYIKKISIKNFFLIALMAVLIQPAANIIAALGSFIFPNNAAEAINEITGIPFLEFIIISAVLPAIFEELIFRGIILSGCRSAGVLKSAVISGLFFGIMHLDPLQFIYAFLIGIILGLLVTYTGSVLSSITAHFVINGTQGLLSYVSYNLVGAEAEHYDLSLEQLITSYIWIFIIAVFFIFLFSVVFSYFIKSNKNNITKPEEEAPEKIITVPFIATIIIFILYLCLMRL